MDKLRVTQEQMDELMRLRNALKDVSFDGIVIPRDGITADGRLKDGYVAVTVPVRMGTMYDADNIIAQLSLKSICADAAQCDEPWDVVDEYNLGIVDGGAVHFAFDEIERR